MSKIQNFLDINKKFDKEGSHRAILADKITKYALATIKQNNSKMSKVFSPRNIARYQKPVFFEFDEFDILARPVFTSKGDVTCDVLIVKEYKHPKGRLFFVGTSKIIFIFKSHFFDRIGQRILKYRPGEKREKSLLLALTDFFFKSIKCELEFKLDIRGTLYLKILNGYALGHASKTDLEHLKRIIVFNTYVTEDMLTPGQKEYLAPRENDSNIVAGFE